MRWNVLWFINPTLISATLVLGCAVGQSSPAPPEAPIAVAEQLMRQGLQQFKANQYEAALVSYGQMLKICQSIEHLACTGKARDSLGYIYASLGQYPQAVEQYQQALVLIRQMGDRSAEAVALNNIAAVYQRLGQYTQALELAHQALILYRQQGDPVGQGYALNNIGGLYQSLGRYPQALDFFQQSVTLYQTLGDESKLANGLSNLGLVYSYLGDYPKALNLFHQALEMQEKVRQLPGQATTLQYIGFVYRQLNQESEAIKFYQKSLTIRRSLPNQDGVAEVLNNIGESYERLRHYSSALQALEEALSLARAVRGRSHEGNILDNLATVYKGMGQYAKAMTLYHQALAIEREVGSRASERITLSNIGNLLRQQNKPVLAIAFYKQSVNLSEVIRQELRVLPRTYQETYTKTISDTYRQLADLLLQQNRVLEAQQVLDLLKVQELEEYLQNVRGSGQNLYELPPEQEILKKYNELQKTAIQLGQELTTLRKTAEGSRTPAQQQRIVQLVKFQEDLNQQFNAFVDRSDVVALTKQLTPSLLRQTVDLSQLDALRNDLRQLNAVLLYPLVLEDRLELVITTPDAPPLRRTVMVKRSDLNATIVQFRSALQNPGSDPKVPAQKLYTWLIKPLEADLNQASGKTIIYAPDGQLRYIPLQALYDGQQWLVQRYRVNNITARSLTEFKTQPVQQPRILAGAFVSGQYTFQVGDRSVPFKGLRFAGDEVNTLATLLPTTKTLIDKAFSRDSTTAQMNEFNVVHLATHASFVPGTATNSFIVFGNGDKATLKDIESWSLNNVDLVVLSACETGLGGKFGNGEEVLGLGYQFQNRGAKAAIASLWSVDDGGTQELMTAFYTALKQGTMTKAEALQKAQIAMIQKGTTATGQSRGDSFKLSNAIGSQPAIARNLSHPYYWAPFILIGNGL